jgi:AGZA family xanthine/uracil permease-like MFS transporter
MAGIFMIQSLRDFDFENWTELVPAAVTILIMTFIYSVAEGILRGIISYTAIKAGSRKLEDISITMVLLSLRFILKELYI